MPAKLLPPRDFPVINLQNGRLTDVWYEYFQNGVPSNKVFGTATNDSAPEGAIGELLTASAVVSLATATPKNVTSLLLTPGDWFIWAPVQFDGTGTTTVTEVLASISTVSATLQDVVGGQHGHFRTTAAITDLMFPMRLGMNVSIAVDTTYYLVAQAAFGVSTYGVTGSIFARRAR